jgi:hypothetical protein
VDRLLGRGHGPAVYGYGLSWFMRCLRAADAADAEAAASDAVRQRLERAARVVDLVIACRGDKQAVDNHLDRLTKE